MERTVKVKDCPVGSTIGKDIYKKDNNRLPLVTEGSTFTERVKTLLLSNDIEEITILIEEESEQLEELDEGLKVSKDIEKFKNSFFPFDDFEKRYKNHLNLVEVIFGKIISGKHIRIKAFNFIANYYISNTDQLPTIIKYINSNTFEDRGKTHHSLSVAIYSIFQGLKLGFEEERLREIFIGALLHDLGKVTGIADEQDHTVVGYDYIKDKKSYSMVIKNIILLHHEAEDGTGYPNGLAGDKIPLEAKIVSIANNYDNLVRNVKESQLVVFQELLNLAYSSKLDLELTLRFVNKISNIYSGSKIKFKNGNEGYIEFIHPKEVRHPIVRVKDRLIDTANNKKYRNFKFI